MVTVIMSVIMAVAACHLVRPFAVQPAGASRVRHADALYEIFHNGIIWHQYPVLVKVRALMHVSYIECGLCPLHIAGGTYVQYIFRYQIDSYELFIIRIYHCSAEKMFSVLQRQSYDSAVLAPEFLVRLCQILMIQPHPVDAQPAVFIIAELSYYPVYDHVPLRVSPACLPHLPMGESAYCAIKPYLKKYL